MLSAVYSEMWSRKRGEIDCRIGSYCGSQAQSAAERYANLIHISFCSAEDYLTVSSIDPRNEDDAEKTQSSSVKRKSKVLRIQGCSLFCLMSTDSFGLKLTSL